MELCKVYGYGFKAVRDIDIGLKYEAMKNGDIDVTNGFTADAQLSKDSVVVMVVMEDDQHSQVNYFCSTVVREEVLENYPGLEDALLLMDGILSDKEMATLNDKVENQGMEAADVAREFLIAKGILTE